MKISACVIVKNEECNLRTWLKQMQDLADEMIVVDTGSTDSSREIAEQGGAKVYIHSWQNDFAAAKNAALEHASGDWVLFLDADEYFSEETKNNIRPYLLTLDNKKEIQAIFCTLINIDADNNNDCISIIESLRIFRRDPRIFFIGEVHEHVVFDGRPLNIIRAETDIEIYHTGYSRGIVRRKFERNLQILLDNIEKFGEKPSDYLYLADCYYGLEDYEKAREYAKKAIQKKVLALGNETGVYRRLIDSTILGGYDKKEVMAAIDFALMKFPALPEFHWNKGQYLFEQKDYCRAESYLKKGLQLFKNAKREIDKGSLAGRVNLLYYTLGKLAALKENFGEAIEYYVISLQIYRYNVFVLQDLYLLLRHQDPVDVLSLLKEIYNDTKSDMIFVVEALELYIADKVYLYYAQRLKKEYKMVFMDLSMNALLATRNYSEIISKGSFEIKDAYLCLIASVVRGKSENQELVSNASVMLPDNYLRVLRYILDGETGGLTGTQKRIYDAVQVFLD